MALHVYVKKNEIRMSYQRTLREIPSLGAMSVALFHTEEEVREYEFSIEGVGNLAVDLNAYYDNFPVNKRVEASYRIADDILSGRSYGFVDRKVGGKVGYTKIDLMLTVFSIINEAYLSYTEQLIMEAGKEEWKKIGEYYPEISMAYDIQLKDGREYSNVIFDRDDDDSFFETKDGLISAREVKRFKRDF